MAQRIGHIRSASGDDEPKQWLQKQLANHNKTCWEPVVARYRNRPIRRYVRTDAAFAMPEVYEFLEAEGFNYSIRVPAN